MKEALEEQLARVRRLFKKQEVIPELLLDLDKLLNEVDEQMGLNQNVFGVLNAEKSADYVVAKEGARAYSMALRFRVQRLEQALKDVESNKGEIDE